MTLEHIKLQYDRLERHHKQALNTQDLISFLDLSHSLRIWVDMKNKIDELVEEQEIKLKLNNIVKNKALKKILKGATHRYLPIGNGVDSPNVQIKGIQIIDRALNADEVKKLYEAGPPKMQNSNLTFGRWLNSSIYEVPSHEEVHPHITISREIMIKRVANILGASHPQGTEFSEDTENRFDSYIKELHQLKIADGYPATYYQLLEISQEILDKVKIIFEK
ncbi:hypothetical protein [Aliarcobacter cryaerophilus]|jgi:hypothetical protein|uniref:hypothetical protein n=1 Tax=Aliarcobacter cryaerophilus TaxID=28198 RepID=UPI00112F333B|nr:hypothetical protein [Aliarcobacter cryaerophilus]MBU9917849.1 hypothetical protein [Fusobacteriaceae bacterium]